MARQVPCRDAVAVFTRQGGESGKQIESFIDREYSSPMGTQLGALEEKASQLSAEERARFALSLIESLEPPEDDAVEEAWRVEAERRWAEIQNGKANLIPVMKSLRKLDRA